MRQDLRALDRFGSGVEMVQVKEVGGKTLPFEPSLDASSLRSDVISSIDSLCGEET